MNKYFRKLFVYVFIAFFVCFSIYFCYVIKQLHEDTEIYQKTYTQLSSISENLSNKLDDLEDKKEELLKHKEISLDITEQLKNRENSINNIKNDYVSNKEMNIFLNDLNTILNKDYSYLANDISFNEINEIGGVAVGNNNKLVSMVNNKEDKANKVSDLDDADDNSYLAATSLSDEFVELFNKMYPINSIYVSVNGVKPLYGEWELVQDGVILWNTEDGGGEYLDPVLPNIESGMGYYSREYTTDGVFRYASAGHSLKDSGGNEAYYQRYVDFSRYCTLYQGTDELKAPSVLTTIYKRVG